MKPSVLEKGWRGVLAAWVRSQSRLRLEQTESVLFVSPANHRGIGGRLVLTTRRLVFEPHRINYSWRLRIVELSAIVGCSEVRLGSMRLPGLEVNLYNNPALRFRVDDPALWVRLLSNPKPE